MLATFHWFRGEGFSMIIEDVLRLPSEREIIVEGFRLLPRLVKPLLAGRNQAVSLIPTPEFRHAMVDNHGCPQWGFIGKTSNPERALSNLLERDAMFTQRLHQEARRLGLKTIAVDSSITVDELAGRVAEALGL